MSHSVLTDPPSTRRRSSAPLLTLFVVLLMALVGRLVFTLAEPPFDGGLDYDDLAGLDGAYWPLNLFLGGPSYLFSFLATAVFLVVLGRGRGRLVTMAGGLLVGLGGALFSLAITAEARPFALATDPAVFGEAEGRALVEVLNGEPSSLFPVVVGAQIAIGLGGLIGLVGVLLSRTTPRWFPVVGLVFVVVSQLLLPAVSPGPVVVLLDYVAQLVLLGAIGWSAVRHTGRD